MLEGCGNKASPLVFRAFDPASFPEQAGDSDQVAYLRRYVEHLGVAGTIEEQSYFDRDYLAEFASFYCTSSRGYPNRCRRIHLFSLELPRLRSCFFSALSGEREALACLERSYRGFVVLRPIEATPIGRTVLAWYDDDSLTNPRVTTPARDYVVHLTGLRLCVRGIAWQQQDSAVGACATIALWAMFHSSALDEHHAIPTTADVTRAANRRWFTGQSAFPANDGLHTFQIREAIRAQGLTAALLEGDIKLAVPDGSERTGFSRRRFASSVAAFLRSGYPVLIGALAADATALAAGNVTGEGHAVCAVGFRPAPSPEVVGAGDALEDDANLQHIYIHDDNIGPNVRFELTEVEGSARDGSRVCLAGLRPSAPSKPGRPPPPVRYVLVPDSLIAALPEEVRLSTDQLNRSALGLAHTIAAHLAKIAKKAGATIPGLTFAARFFRLKDYVGSELAARLSGTALAKARLTLCERVRPMSLHLGVARIGAEGVPILDVLFDTTDSLPASEAFAHIVFDHNLARHLRFVDLGRRVLP